MAKIIDEIKNYIYELNRQTEQEWGDRFAIVYLDQRGGGEVRRLVNFAMMDNELGIIEEAWSPFFILGKLKMGYKIWDCFNNFVNDCLSKKK